MLAVDPHLHCALSGLEQGDGMEISPKAPCDRIALRLQPFLRSEPRVFG